MLFALLKNQTYRFLPFRWSWHLKTHMLWEGKQPNPKRKRPSRAHRIWWNSSVGRRLMPPRTVPWASHTSSCTSRCSSSQRRPGRRWVSAHMCRGSGETLHPATLDLEKKQEGVSCALSPSAYHTLCSILPELAVPRHFHLCITWYNRRFQINKRKADAPFRYSKHQKKTKSSLRALLYLVMWCTCFLVFFFSFCLFNKKLKMVKISWVVDVLLGIVCALGNQTPSDKNEF